MYSTLRTFQKLVDFIKEIFRLIVFFHINNVTFNCHIVLETHFNKFAIECKWREKLKTDLSKDLFPAKRIENYKNFSKTRNMPVSIILGVGGEPGNPDWLYRISLENLTSIISGTVSITKFLIPASTFEASTFVRQKKVREKAYTM